MKNRIILAIGALAGITLIGVGVCSSIYKANIAPVSKLDIPVTFEVTENDTFSTLGSKIGRASCRERV